MTRWGYDDDHDIDDVAGGDVVALTLLWIGALVAVVIAIAAWL